ncbi:MAG: hypothetical protein AAF530_06795 [Pseudomonadota bacterium]
MPENSLIKRRFKYKLPQGLSHPIGAQSISEYFADIPMFDEIELVMGDKLDEPMGIFMPGWGHKLKNPPQRLDFSELAQAYYSSSATSDSLDWTLQIRPVPSQQKNAIKEILVGNGFRNIKKWLKEYKPETWYEGYRCLQIGINDDFTELFVLETHNQWVVHKKVVPIQ